MCAGGVGESMCLSLHLSPVLMNIKAVKAPNTVVYKNCIPETQQHKDQYDPMCGVLNGCLQSNKQISILKLHMYVHMFTDDLTSFEFIGLHRYNLV